ncbi:unnamed protein product [Paramecium sonneborni]|uniref:Uncharacterized protein n=1 Tax=Paramecium sonneborni TaxID=65129 RepID=A0A8S1R4N0_9CILI|nr:unnamed protein product [Paramecium sonneborni]
MKRLNKIIVIFGGDYINKKRKREGISIYQLILDFKWEERF